jgi:hypothetical protein
MYFYKFFLLLWVIFALLDPDPDSESESTDPIESGSGFGSATLLQNMIFLYFLYYRGLHALVDPDLDPAGPNQCGSGSTTMKITSICEIL